MSDLAIKVEGASKFYKLYNLPGDRLREALSPFGTKYHKRYYALNKINLEVKKGEILGIVGKNGCGKSTLLKLIAGVLVPNEGVVTVNGKISALLELGSGFNPEFTGLQNIFFYGSILGFSRHDMEKKLNAIIEFADIGDFINQQIKTYSSGMKARLSFAVAVHIDPEILILDEVLSVGDALFQRKCYAKMEEFFNGGKTILFVSHNADSVNQLCTRAVLIDDGNIKMDDDPKTVTTYYQKMLFTRESLGADKSSGANDISEANEKGIMVVSQQASKSLSHYLPELIPVSTVKYENEDVCIKNVRILNEAGEQVNLLEFKSNYRFVAEVDIGIDAKKVTFGFEIKDEKGVRLATVESEKMYRRGAHYSVNKGDVYCLEYSFKCLFKTGMYYLNFGVSSFEYEQRVLSRIVDVLVFKTSNEKGVSSGYLDLVEKVKISTGASVNTIEIF